MKRISAVLLAFLVGAVFTSCFQTTLSSNDGVTWIKYPRNPLNLGLADVSAPWVIYDGQMFKMWYTGARKIHYATSPDGINWAPYGVVLDIGESGSWDDYIVQGPVVLFDGIRYRMWYLGCRNSRSYMIGYAISSDGIIWAKHEANPVLVPGENGGWDDWALSDFTVILDGTLYRMWYGGQAYYAGTTRIGAATSVDGISWTKYSNNPVLVTGPDQWDSRHVIGGPVIKNGSCYQMWYSGVQFETARVGLATSPDGFSWSKYTGNPVLDIGSPGSWDSERIYSYCIVEKDNRLMMWYTGCHPGGRNEIGLATSYAIAEVNFDPDTLNLKSNGEWITAYIELPGGYSVGDIDVFSTSINGTISVDSTAPTQIGDYDGDGTPDLMVKFDRSAVTAWLATPDYQEDTGKSYEVTLSIAGKVAGTRFEGSDTVRVLLKG